MAEATYIILIFINLPQKVKGHRIHRHHLLSLVLFSSIYFAGVALTGLFEVRRCTSVPLCSFFKLLIQSSGALADPCQTPQPFVNTW